MWEFFKNNPGKIGLGFLAGGAVLILYGVTTPLSAMVMTGTVTAGCCCLILSGAILGVASGYNSAPCPTFDQPADQSTLNEPSQPEPLESINGMRADSTTEQTVAANSSPDADQKEEASTGERLSAVEAGLNALGETVDGLANRENTNNAVALKQARDLAALRRDVDKINASIKRLQENKRCQCSVPPQCGSVLFPRLTNPPAPSANDAGDSSSDSDRDEPLPQTGLRQRR